MTAMNLRLATLIVSAITTSATVGRAMLANRIDRKTEDAIEASAGEARARIRHEAAAYLGRHVRRFAIATLVKTVLLAAAWGGFRIGWIDGAAFSWTLFALLALFLVRDAILVFPGARLALTDLHRHGWKPRRALSEVIAARVFDEVQAEAASRVGQSRRESLMLALAGRRKDEVTGRIAAAVADVARQTSWQDLRPFLLVAAAKFSVLFVLYSAFVWLILLFGR